MIYRYVVIQLSSSYGNLRAKPIGTAARCFASIAGTATLTPAALRRIFELGIPVMADGSHADRAELERSIGAVGLESGRPRFYPVLIEYRPGAEEELDPTIEAHLDSKAEHGT